jgi:hypothetical protein
MGQEQHRPNHRRLVAHSVPGEMGEVFVHHLEPPAQLSVARIGWPPVVAQEVFRRDVVVVAAAAVVATTKVDEAAVVDEECLEESVLHKRASPRDGGQLSGHLGKRSPLVSDVGGGFLELCECRRRHGVFDAVTRHDSSRFRASATRCTTAFRMVVPAMASRVELVDAPDGYQSCAVWQTRFRDTTKTQESNNWCQTLRVAETQTSRSQANSAHWRWPEE